MDEPTPTLPPGGYVELPGRGTAWVWDTGPAPDRPTVVLLHGWTTTAALNFSRCFAPLSATYRVIAPDHRGHGRGIRGGWPFRLEDCADDVASLVDHLGTGPVVLVGYSMGGPVAQLVWQRHRRVVAGMVLCATASSFPGPAAPELAVVAAGLGLSLALSAVPAALRQEGFRRLMRIRPDATTMTGWAREESQSGDPVAFVQAGVALNQFDSRPWVNEVDVPVAVVVTTQDTTVPPARQRTLAEAVPGAVTFEVDAGHRACADAAAVFVPVLCDAVAGVLEAGRCDGGTARPAAG